MDARIRSITGYDRRCLDSGWMIAAASPGPRGRSEEPLSPSDWRRIDRLTTVGDACQGPSQCMSAGRIDAKDWWYRLSFPHDGSPGGTALLCFDGLAGLADVWLNGRKILASENMFVAHEVPVGLLLASENDLVLRFRSVDAELAGRKQRPSWRTPMVEHQQLRWLRATLLGRTPGWSPPVPVVGPWRPIWLEERRAVGISGVHVDARVEGTQGVMDVRCALHALEGTDIRGCDLVVESGGRDIRVPLQDNGKGRLVAHIVLPEVDLWWPHTHGEQPLYPVRLETRIDDPASPVVADLGLVGFRTISLDQGEGRFALSVNGVPIFCRGANWMPLDCISFRSRPPAVEVAMRQARDGGFNMVRVSGAAVYEDDCFLDACDRRGLLLWQDFMFAGMDYPGSEPHFRDLVRKEADQQLRRLSGHPCLAVLCGNSEVEQQAAMAGAPRERWQPALFHDELAGLCDSLCTRVPYWPSSAHGGSFPHRNDVGTTSYYGIGAYLRPMSDMQTSRVRFATECLAFANVPERATLEKMPGGGTIKVHHPSWKERVPRDRGAGWDFDDVRDHYLALHFGVNPLQLRQADHARYLDLSRIVTGEVMRAVFQYWRRPDSGNHGGLIWFLRDLWPGAGWGIIGSDGVPKAAFHLLRRALQPVAVALSDEGCNGVDVHVWNDRPGVLRARLEVSVFRQGEIPLMRKSQQIDLPGRGYLRRPVAEFIETLLDLNHAYRFGPPSHDLICAVLRDPEGTALAEDQYLLFPERMIEPSDIGLTASIGRDAGGEATITLASRGFAYGITIEGEELLPDDQYLNVPPGEARTVGIGKAGEPVKAVVRAINSRASVRVSEHP